MKEFFQSILNYDRSTQKFARVRTLIIWLCGIVILLAFFFGYTSNVEIDEGTPELYQTLSTLFIVFLVLGIIAILVIAGFLALNIYDKTIYYKTHRKKKIRIHAFDVINFTWMAIFCLLCIYPLYYVLIGSFNQGADYSKGGVYLLPRLFTFENYKVVLKEVAMWKSYGVTIARTALGTLTALVFTSAVAYAMSRSNLRFKKVFYALNIFTMFFGGGLVPYFLIIKMVGLYDSFWVYIIPGLYSVYNMIVMSSFFKSISNEIHEAAIMDGANEFRIWWQIYIPLSKPVLATVALWLSIGHWNSYFDTMIYTTSEKYQTLQYYLLKAINSSTITEGMPAEMLQRVSARTISLAAIIISIIPVLFFFPFIRKNFQSGIMVGSLKG